jgi:hypothetical protein
VAKLIQQHAEYVLADQPPDVAPEFGFWAPR